MDTSRFDAEIAAIEARLAGMKPPMEALVRQFASQVRDFVVSWVAKKVKDEVVAQPDRAKQCGKEGIEAVKREIAAFEVQAREVVEELFLDDKLWTHRKQLIEYPHDEDRKYLTYGRALPDSFDPLVRRMLGCAALILEKHKFTGNKFYEAWDRDYDRKGGSSFKYKYSVDYPPELNATLKSYADACKPFGTEISRLAAVKKGKSEAEVEDLWG